MSEPFPSVYVVDDDPSVRVRVARLLRSAGFLPETFASGNAVLDYLRAGASPDCLVLDVHMPGISGIDVQRRLVESAHPVPIVFITGRADVPTSVLAMKAGAVDFLSKPLQDELLLGAVREALDRHRRSCAEAAEREAYRAAYALLTARERQVMELVVRGLSNKQIAVELGVGEKTIKVHRGRVMKKMRVQSLAELVRAALKLDARSNGPHGGPLPG
jgi:FixJ family two-component response regulator